MDRRGNTGIDSLVVGARNSPLSHAQVWEVHKELQQFHPDVLFTPIFIDTSGDKDRITSLRSMENSNFFTKELDDLLLQKQVRIAIHSAKDLPSPLPEGLFLVALTKGRDPRDAVVFRTHDTTLETLNRGARIGTSSIRREKMLQKIRPDFQFVDIRGNIDMRLQLLENHTIDALVVAECALLRLHLDHLPRQLLEDETAPLQGRLAILARTHDHEMHQLFSCL